MSAEVDVQEKEPKSFTPKQPVQLDPPKDDLMTYEELAKCDGKRTPMFSSFPKSLSFCPPIPSLRHTIKLGKYNHEHCLSPTSRFSGPAHGTVVDTDHVGMTR